jgi:hypothetical protein
MASRLPDSSELSSAVACTSYPKPDDDTLSATVTDLSEVDKPHDFGMELLLSV